MLTVSVYAMEAQSKIATSRAPNSCMLMAINSYLAGSTSMCPSPYYLKRAKMSHQSKRGLKPRINESIVGIKTTDRVQIMMLKKFVHESTVLKERIRKIEGKGLFVHSLMTQQEFDTIKEYLKEAAKITELQALCRNAVTQSEKDDANRNLNAEYKRQYDALSRCVQACCKHIEPEKLCDHVEERHAFWRHLLKISTKLGIIHLRSVLTVIGQQRGFLKPTVTDEVMAQKKAAFYRSLLE